jgi:Fe2+ transport system protein FeoA
MCPKGDRVVNIYSLGRGQSARILGFDCQTGGHAQGEVLKRLIELGFSEGVCLTVVWRDPLPGGPVVVEIRGGQVALGKREAEALLVSDDSLVGSKGVE